MKFDINKIIGSFLKERDTVFTSDEFLKDLKGNGIHLSKVQVENLLHSSDFVFSLVDDKFITRAGVFSGCFFSFKPSIEEIKCGRFIIGHRCMPFINPDVTPDSVIVFSNNCILAPEPCKFSMNFALDTFALYGKSYALSCIFSDRGNKEVSLDSIDYSMPSKISLMSWSFSELNGGKDIQYGDRVICRVVDWEHNVVDMFVEHDDEELVVTMADIEREEWYSSFESMFIQSLEKYGPESSIEEQLAFLFLENLDELCIRNCGSIEEFLSHTKKIDFEPYGFETRLWKKGECVPYIGKWNKYLGKVQIIFDLTIIFSSQVIDAYIKNSLYKEFNQKESDNEFVEEFLDGIVPQILSVTPKERNAVLLKIKKRRDILREDYDPFRDCIIADIRERTLKLFTKVCSLLCSVGCSSVEIFELPQQELVILSQLYRHLLRLLEEFNSEFSLSRFPVGDVNIYLDGMEDTFGEIDSILESAIEESSMKGFEIISDDS